MRKVNGMGVELRMMQTRAPQTGCCGSLIKDVMTDDTDNGLQYTDPNISFPQNITVNLILYRWFGAGQSRTIELTVRTTNYKDLFRCLFSLLNAIIILLLALFFQLFLHLQSLLEGITFYIHITGLSIPRQRAGVDVDFLRFWDDVSLIMCCHPTRTSYPQKDC